MQEAHQTSLIQGVAICDTLFREFLKEELSTIDPSILSVAAKYGADTNYLYIRNMPSEYQQPIIHVYMASLHKVFTMPLVVAGIAVICALCTRNVKYGASKPTQSSTAEQDKPATTCDPQDIDLKQDDTNRTIGDEEIEEKKPASVVQSSIKWCLMQ